LQTKKPETKVKESAQERILRITGFDRYQCPFAKQESFTPYELLPRIRSPTNLLYKNKPV